VESQEFGPRSKTGFKVIKDSLHWLCLPATEIRKFVTTFADDSKTMAQLVFMKTSVLVEVWQIHGQEDIKLCPGE
jgi:hypothetical protein